jgi:murein DD-endopeptidase MepM/ murein hydrolase activator NlpD
MPVLTFVLLTLVPALPPPTCLLPPVAAPVVDPFREPPCTWCPGNRGLTYATDPDAIVRAAAAGTVTFSGSVAGTRYVVVDHGDGRRATYGGLAGSALHSGDRIGAGAVVGHSTAALHFGIREGDEYVDPAPLLGRLVERVRLVPTDGTAPRPAPPPRLRCPVARAG